LVGRFKLRVIAPCSESWNGTAGDDRERFCTRCSLTVHDISAMTDADARALLAGPAERVCVRFGVRRDGTVVTRGPTRWFDGSLSALGVAVAAIVFWAGVTLLQRPWRMLARRLAASTSPAPFPLHPEKDDEERRRAYDELQKQLAAARRALLVDSRETTMMGTSSLADGDWIRQPLGSWFDGPKHAEKSRR
jgi:hypothetical protein